MTQGGIGSSLMLISAILLLAFEVTVAEQCSHPNIEDTHYSCPKSQYCCGPDKCCSPNDYYYSIYDLWYFWFCMCFGIFICSLASGAYYRKRQLRAVQVSAIVPDRGVGHPDPMVTHRGQGMMAMGPSDGLGIVHPAPPLRPQQRNIMVTTTATSGQPMYPQGYYDVPLPNYPIYNTLGGPMYPAYASYMPPPPAYSSLMVQAPPTPTTLSQDGQSSSTETANATGGNRIPEVAS